MEKPKIRLPSALHFARVYDPDPDVVAAALLKLALNAPPLSYAGLLPFARPVMLGQLSGSDVLRQLERSRLSDLAKSQFRTLIPILADAFRENRAAFVVDLDRLTLPIARSVSLYVSAPVAYGSQGNLTVPFPLFWKTNPLDQIRLGLFAEVARRAAARNPDLDGAELVLHDYSAKSGGDRTLLKTDLNVIRELGDTTFQDAIACVLAGMRLAEEKLPQALASMTRRSRLRDDGHHRRYGDLLGDN